MLIVTNVLLGIIIVFLFIISERLNDMYYGGPEHIEMTKEDLKTLLGDIEEEE